MRRSVYAMRNAIRPIALAAAVFLLAGAVKGVVGLGLPTVSLGLLTVAFDLTTAMALLIAPSLLTNLFQACSGGGGYALVKRLWPFLVAAAVAAAGLTLALFLGTSAAVRAAFDLTVPRHLGVRFRLGDLGKHRRIELLGLENRGDQLRLLETFGFDVDRRRHLTKGIET